MKIYNVVYIPKGLTQDIDCDCQEEYKSGYNSGYTSGYTDGVEDGYGSGYTSGKTDGIVEQKAKLVATAITANGTYSRPDGYSSISVNVAQTGHTDQELLDAFNSGYTNGKAEGYDSGKTDGYDSGWTAGYASGYTNGLADCSGYTPTTATAITLNIPSAITGSAQASVVVSPQDAETDLVYTSSDYTVATVDENGLITVFSDGTVTICVEDLISGLRDCKTISATFAGYSSIPLSFEIISGGTIVWTREGGASTESKTIQYNKNGGGWTNITSDTGSSAPYVNVVPGDIISFRGNNTTYFPGTGANIFRGDAFFKAYGNILSLIYGSNYQNETELPSGDTRPYTNNFHYLFYQNSGITDASNIIMPQNTKVACYMHMFGDCINLEKAPTLPASTLGLEAYKYMFGNCHKLDYIKCLATDISAVDCTAGFTIGIQEDLSGTFVKHPDMNDWEIDSPNGIPAGWTVVDAS